MVKATGNTAGNKKFLDIENPVDAATILDLLENGIVSDLEDSDDENGYDEVQSIPINWSTVRLGADKVKRSEEPKYIENLPGEEDNIQPSENVKSSCGRNNRFLRSIQSDKQKEYAVEEIFLSVL